MSGISSTLWLSLIVLCSCGQHHSRGRESESPRAEHQRYDEQSYSSDELLADYQRYDHGLQSATTAPAPLPVSAVADERPAEAPTVQDEGDYSVSQQLRPGPSILGLYKQIPAAEGHQLLKEQLRVLDAYLRRYKNQPDIASAEEIAQRGYITGCLDFAAIYGSLLREHGLKVAYIHGIDIEWIRAKQSGQFVRGYKGHAFVQVFLDGRWQLIDAPAGRLYPDCPLTDKVLPSGYILQYKGADLWSQGIRSIRDLNQEMDRYAFSVRLPRHTKSTCVAIELRSPGQFRHPLQ